MKQVNGIYKFLVYLVLILGAIIMILPFIWMIITSLKTYHESILIPPSLFPVVPQWNNFVEVFKSVPFGKLYLNTIIVTIVVTLGQTFIAAMAAYSFARLDFPFKNIIFTIVLSVLMVPGQVFYLPQYITMQQLGLLDTLTALILPNLFTAYGTFLLRQFFMTLPVELEEAATIDGCGRWKIFFSISLPLAKPGLISLSIFTMLFSWNDLLWPTIVNSSITKMTLSPGLSIFQGQYATKYPLLMAGALMAIIPLIVIFLIFQKQFIEGIALSGMKS